MSKFKVGDLVIGDEDCSYSITNKTTICKVVKVVDDKYMKVKVIKHFKDRPTFYSKDTIFHVRCEYFKKYIDTKSEIELEIEEIEKKMKSLEGKLDKLKMKNDSINYNGNILNGKIHIKNKISIDTDKKLLDTAKYSDYSEINVTAEKELNDIKVILENKSDEIKVTGISKTHPEDDFDVKIGTELAYYRALEKFYGEKVKRIVKKLY